MRNRLISRLVRSTVMRSHVQGYIAPIRVQSSLVRHQSNGSFAESQRKFSTLPTDRQTQQSPKQLKIFAEVNGKRSAIKIADSEDVDALRKQIKKEFARQLNAYDAADLVLTTSANSTEALNPEAILRDVLIDAQGNQLKYVYVKPPLAPGVSYWWQKFEGKQDILPWQTDDKATAYFSELLSQEAQKVPILGINDEGESCDDGELVVIGLPSSLQRDEQRTTSNLVLPPSTREMWQVVLNGTYKEMSDQQVIVIGSPGLGKSRSIPYFIKLVIEKRKLEKEKRDLPVIVFEHRKDGLVWLLAPIDPTNPESSYETFSVDRAAFSAKSCFALNNPNNYYVVDTSQAKAGHMPPLVAAVTIYVCSPDTRHYSEFQKHDQRGFKVFCPHWRPQDILAARKFMTSPELEEEVVRKRMQIVGPIPRRLFCDEIKFNEFKGVIDNTLSKHPDEIEHVLTSGSLALEADTKHAQKPRSAVFMFGVSDKSYQRPSIHFVSDYARSRVSLDVLRKVMLDVSFRDPSRAVELSKILERVCFRLLDAGWRGQLKPIPIAGVIPKGLSAEVHKGSGVKLVQDGDGLRKRVYELMQKMPCLPKTCVPIYFGSTFPLFDAADARNRGWNVTLAQTKSLSSAIIAKVRAGLQLADDQMLHLVYLVPHGTQFTPSMPKDATHFSKMISLFVAELPSPLDDKAWSVVSRQELKKKIG